MVSKSGAVQEDKQNERVQLLSDLAGSLLLSDNPHEILDVVFERLSAHLGLEAYFNYLVTEDGGRLRLYNHAGVPGHIAREIEWLDYGQAVCGCVARDKKRIVAEDVQCSANPRTGLIKSLGITAYCCHPLIAHDKLIGTLSFGTRNRTKFAQDEIELMRIVSNLIASALERKLAEEALRASEEMLRHIIDTSPVPMVLYNEEKKIYFFNRKFAETFGYTIEDAPGINEWWTLAYPDERYRELVKKRWYEAVDHAVKNKASIAPQEAEVTCKDGSKRYVLGEFSSIGSMNLAVLYDITERKRAEEAITRSEQMLQLVMDNIPQGIFWKDRNSTYMGCNKVLAKAAGLGTPRDIIGKTDYDLPWFREQADFFREYDSKVMENDAPEYHIVEQQREASGRTAWVETNKIPLHDAKGNVTGILGTYEDITERRRAEEALRESEERFRLLADKSPIPMAINDKDDNITYLNKKFIEIFGYTLKDIPHLRSWWLLAYSDPVYRKDAIRRWEKGVEEAVRESKEIGPLDYTVTCKDGSVRYIEISGVPIGDRELVLLQDVTERKRAEEELIAAKQQAELYLDLMGHDINNMHQVALGYLELARDMPAGGGQVAFLDKSVEVLQRSAMLIQNVRKLQNLRDSVFRTRDVNVCSVLSDVQREFETVPNKKIKLNLNGYEHCYVRANELLHDVFSNLVGNAVKHTGDRADIVVDLGIVNDKGGLYCRVAVEDDGPGIPDDFKAKIFNRALKGSDKAKGMGLGLYLVKSLVDSYNGRVWVEDRIPGDHTKGARFVVMLPAIEK